MDGWNTTFFLGRPIFRSYVSFRECTFVGMLSTNDDLVRERLKKDAFSKKMHQESDRVALTVLLSHFGP